MTDWPDLLEPVARELLGEPSRRTTSGEWRLGLSSWGRFVRKGRESNTCS